MTSVPRLVGVSRVLDPNTAQMTSGRVLYGREAHSCQRWAASCWRLGASSLAMVPSLLILSTLGSSGQDVSVTNAYCTSRWLVRGLGAELATNLAGRGRKRWRHTLRTGLNGEAPPVTVSCRQRAWH